MSTDPSLISEQEATQDSYHSPQPAQNNRIKQVILTLLALLAFGTVGAGAYYLGYDSGKNETGSTQPTPSASGNNQNGACTEDTKICPDGTTVGRVPPNCEFAQCPAPTPSSQAETTDWETYTIADAGITFSAPSDLEVTFNTQRNSNTGAAYSATLYVQKGMPTADYYQLYGTYQWGPDYSNQSLQALKADLEPTTVKDTTISGYPAVEGQIKGERNRFVTYIRTDKGLLSLFTAEATQENKRLTDSIIKTFKIE